MCERLKRYSIGIRFNIITWHERCVSLYHTDACAALHGVDGLVNVVRVKEGDVLKDRSPWKPCLDFHEKRYDIFTAIAVRCSASY